MTQLVDELEKREHEPQPQETGGGEQPFREVRAQAVPARCRVHRARRHHREPHERAEPAEDWPHEGQQVFQQSIGVEDRQALRQRAHQPAWPLAALIAIVTAQQLLAVGRDVALQHVGGMQLPQQLDHLVLGGSGVAEPGGGGVPDLLDGPLPVHQTDDIVGCRGKAVITRGGVVLKHVPQMTAIVVTMHLRVPG